MKTLTLRIGGAILAAMMALPASAETANEPWKRDDRALVIDAYEYNPIDWDALSSDERVGGFINKASDGLPPQYRCKGSGMEYDHCRLAWKRYSVTKELYHTRKTMAKSLGYVWGSYHLGRPGNPEEQADHFLQFADPQDDELIAIDIEDNDPEKFMSLEDAEIFAKRIKARTGRWPVLYTNGSTSEFIAQRADEYPILSRLQIWYARYRTEIEGVFPLGNWENYALWQFASHINCKGKSSCPYRPLGTAEDIDVNVAPMNKAALQKAWPFGELAPQRVPDEILVAENEDTDEGQLAAAGEMVEVATADEGFIAMPTPMRSPRDSGEAVSVAALDEAEADNVLADAAGAVTTSKSAGEMMAFAGRSSSKRTAGQALANFVSGKTIGPVQTKSDLTVSAFTPAKSTNAAEGPSEKKASKATASDKEDRATADEATIALKSIDSGKKTAAVDHSKLVSNKRMTRASLLSAERTQLKKKVTTKVAPKTEKREESEIGFFERIQAIIDNTPERPSLPLLGWNVENDATAKQKRIR
ncbi:GH25 family lysozyme [Notoacmeibacter ruber]|nr:GH25 family lysozyme [Notoacmeibacter ruber]